MPVSEFVLMPDLADSNSVLAPAWCFYLLHFVIILAHVVTEAKSSLVVQTSEKPCES